MGSNDRKPAAKASPSDSLTPDFESVDDYDKEKEDELHADLSSDDDPDEQEEFDADSPEARLRDFMNEVAEKRRGRGRRGEQEDADDNSPEANLRYFMQLFEDPEYMNELEREDRSHFFPEDDFDFPRDREGWTEGALGEFWAEAPRMWADPGWDPLEVTNEDWGIIKEQFGAGVKAPVAPFYLPYYRYYPVMPFNIYYDISDAKSLIEELDRIEECLTWVSYIFQDGSSYEGTVWDDQAYGKGVYVADRGLVRYEGEWFQNAMDGHGVVEVDIPDIQPRPGSKLEAKMRAEGKIIKRDFMSPDDQKWLDMDIEDSIRLANGWREIPFYENDKWIKMFGQKPEKGRYKYAGQWKHGRMHGCGVYEVNEQILYGRFYFGQYTNDSTGCDADISALHAGIAEVAAAKARMFVNKPDGMVREERGPYGDPQHPYFYEEEDVWMAPGFINQFHETPDYWKTYVEEVDQEREMWLNSFYKAPLRIPMPAELEYWWKTDESDEFVLLNKEPEPDPEDPSKLVYTEDPLILHTRTGKLIDYVDDEKYGIRLFWMPDDCNDLMPLEEGEDVNQLPLLEKGKDVNQLSPLDMEYLPLGFDEFYGRVKPVARKENWLVRLIISSVNAIKPKLEQLDKWVDEKKKASELNLKLIDHELDLVEAEICLEEEMEEFKAEVERKLKEEEKGASQIDVDDSTIPSVREADSDEEEEDDGEETASSFGIASAKNSETSKDDKKGRQPGTSPFSSLSMSFGTFASATQVPKKILGFFLRRNQESRPSGTRLSSSNPDTFHADHTANATSISYPRKLSQTASLRVARNKCHRPYTPMQNNLECLVSAGVTVLKRSKAKFSQNDSWHADHGFWKVSDLERHPLCVLSLHVPLGSPQICSRLDMPL